MTRGRLHALALLFTLASALFPLLAPAAEAPLPKDLQGLKGELLNLNRDITQLEKELLFPSTETAVVIALDSGATVKIVDVKLILDDKDVGYHFYSDAELAALAKGGMQRLYSGNLSSGSHSLKAVFTVRDAEGKESQRFATYNFTKNAQRKAIEVKVADTSGASQGNIRFREWDSQ
ncbi:MAG: hypothetical protein K0R03_1503 [Moraxellaceae bacterium]|jgi:hypothetical protein|nr:hypothetical protein [Moraxellaceae bacterium]